MSNDKIPEIGVYSAWPVGKAPTCGTCPMMLCINPDLDKVNDTFPNGSGMCMGWQKAERVGRWRVACPVHPAMKAMLAILEENARIDIVKMKIGVGDG